MYSSPEAKNIIEDIYNVNTGHGLEGLNDPRTKKAWNKKNSDLDSALQKLSEDLYKKKTHFVMELIQNAEDNTYDPTVQPFIKFSINPGILVVYNNELGFTPEDVENICSVGQTIKSKKKDEGYIGEKGIGFKSVFKVSDSPKIISNGFQFEFKRSDGSNLGYIVPYWLPTIPEYADRQVTNIILPLRDDARERLNLFDEIDPTLILFLRKLQRIEIIDNINDNSKTVTKSGSEGLVAIDYQNQSQYWRVIRATARVPQEIAGQEPRREDVRNTDVVLAFPVSETGLPISIRKESKPDIFAFLPVKKCGFNFIIQADFLLTSNREDILQDSLWNQWLRSSIPDVLVKALEEFKRDEELRTTFFKYLSLPEEIDDEFFNPLMHQTFQAFSNIECILTESGSWKRPCDVYYAEGALKALVSNDELRSNFGKEYVADTFYLKKELRDLLGIEDFTPKLLIECLKHPEWVKKHSNEWFIQLYRYCAQQMEKAKSGNLTLDDVVQLPIIKLENGEYCSAKSGQVFLYLERAGKKYGFESDLKGTLRVLDAGIRDAIKAEEDANDLKEFLKKLNVINPDPGNIVSQHILPQYRTGTWRKKPPEILQGHIHFIKDHFEKLQKVEGLVETIRKTIYLRVNGKQSQSDYRHPDQIHLSDDYGSDYHLSSIMAAAGETFFQENSLHPCYARNDLQEIDVKIQQILTESKPRKGRRAKKRVHVQKQLEEVERSKKEIVSSWKEFLLCLGVHEGIIVSLDPETECYQGGGRADNQVTKKKIWPNDLNSTLWNSSGWQKTKNWYFLEDDYISTDLDRIFDCFNKATWEQKAQISSMLFKLLVNNWEDYRGFRKCRYYYRHSYEQGWSYAETQSTVLLKLKTFAWAITADGDFAPLKGLFLNNSDIKKTLGDSVRYIGHNLDWKQHAAFIENMEIRTKVDIDEIIEVIASKVLSGSEDIEEFKSLYLLLQSLVPKKAYSVSFFDPPRRPDPALHAFREKPLIFVPETNQKYFTADGVFWNCKIDELKEYLPSLKFWYPECRVLFVENLVVKLVPTSENLVTVLEHITAKAEISEGDERKILTIYKEFNRCLKQNPGDSNATWWKVFTDKLLLWVDKKQFWRNDGDVFVNDDPDLYKLFVDREDIAFLAVDITELRDLEQFIGFARIQKLSESVECVFVGHDGHNFEEEPEFTQRIQSLVPYILRYLYHKHSAEYEHLKELHKLDTVRDLRCILLDSINVKYVLKGQAVEATTDVLLDGHTLYISTNDRAKIAAEFAKFFGPIKELNIFVFSLSTCSNPESIESFLKSSKIPQLPYAENDWLTSLLMAEKTQKTTEVVASTEIPMEGNSEISLPSAGMVNKCLPPEGHSTASDAVEQVIVSSPISSTSIAGNDSIGTAKIVDRSQPKRSSRQEFPPDSQNAEGSSSREENEEIDILLAQNPVSVHLVPVTFSPRQRENQFDGPNRSIILEKPEPKERPDDSERYSQDKRSNIGHWGEEVVYQYLKREIKRCHPNASISDTEEGFVTSINGKTITKVVWYNKTRESGDRGYGHDIKIIENGNEEYIEVKSSIKPGRAFMVSKNEWNLAKESGDRYFIYHIYRNPQDDQIICEKIQDPVGKWQMGELEARVIQVIL